MELSEAGILPHIAFVIFSLVLPIGMVVRERPQLPPQRARKRLGVATAILAVFPLPSVLFWDKLGIPPTRGPWLCDLLFFLGMVTALLLIAAFSQIMGGPLWRAVLAALSFSLLANLLSAAPLAIMLFDIHSYQVIVHSSNIAATACHAPEVKPLFAHISDLHISDQPKTRDGQHPGNSRLGALLASINAFKPPYLLISGDITDLGTASQ